MDPQTLHRGPGTWAYFLAGVLFGIVITRGEVISWFRIQEMFRFQGFHMFGVFATALPTAIVSVQFLKRRGVHTLGARRFRSGRSLSSPAFDTRPAAPSSASVGH